MFCRCSTRAQTRVPRGSASPLQPLRRHEREAQGGQTSTRHHPTEDHQVRPGSSLADPWSKGVPSSRNGQPARVEILPYLCSGHRVAPRNQPPVQRGSVRDTRPLQVNTRPLVGQDSPHQIYSDGGSSRRPSSRATAYPAESPMRKSPPRDSPSPIGPAGHLQPTR